MASYWTNRGKYEVASLAVTSQDLRLLLTSVAPVDAATAADINFVSDVITNENAGAGYARKVLTGVTMTENDANDRVVFDANDPTIYATADFGTVAGGYLYRQVTNDSDSPVWMWLGLTDTRVTNGGNFTFNFNPSGISYLT